MVEKSHDDTTEEKLDYYTAKGYKQYYKETSTCLGPRCPEGTTGPMAFTSRLDLQLTFQQLSDGESGLHRGQALKWLRACGFICSDASLEDMLTRSTVGQLVEKKIEFGFYTEDDLTETLHQTKFGEWQFEDLLEVLEDNKTQPNSSVRVTHDVLDKLSGGQDKIEYDRLRSLCETHEGISGEMLDECLELVGLREGGSMSCESLAQALLDAVVKPPSVWAVHKMNKK
eukprot:TRINITY_DN22808_c0_g1_i2.p1 TRINITY_DN22808_c0_g1~~TRINITY_DN22808_c0_g1_i2.p1  ORF type:complete len:245 (+),score=28.04 TRINITY_DN22808_c0_g1_i2:54-737(+)